MNAVKALALLVATFAATACNTTTRTPSSLQGDEAAPSAPATTTACADAATKDRIHAAVLTLAKNNHPTWNAMVLDQPATATPSRIEDGVATWELPVVYPDHQGNLENFEVKVMLFPQCPIFSVSYDPMER